MKTHLFCSVVIAVLVGVLFPVSAPAANPTANQGSAQLFIQRAANFGSGLILHVSVDGKEVSLLGVGDVYSASLSPGPHVISVMAYPNRLYLQPTKKNITVEAGKTYAYTAIWQGEQLALK
jgi:hypothetical protein